MRQVLWTVALLAVAAPALFANSNLETRITRGIAQAQSNPPVSNEQKEIILQQLDVVRRLVKNAEEYNSSIVMQAIVRLADVFFAYIPQQAGIPANVESFHAKQENEMQAWALLIDQPIQAGWNQEESFVISQAIDQFLREDACQWGGQKEKQELAVFSAIIRRYSPWISPTSQTEKVENSGKKNPGNESKTHREPVLPLSTHLRQ